MLLFVSLAAGVLWALRHELSQHFAEPLTDQRELTSGPAEPANFGVPAEATAPDVPPPLDLAKDQLDSAGKLLALGMLGKLLCGPVLWFTSGIVLARARFLFLEAWNALTVERKPRIIIVDALTLAFSFLSGWFFINILLYWFYRAFNYIALKTEDHSRNQLIDVYAKQPRKVWGLIDDVEVELPFESLKAGDLVVLRAGDLVPVDGEIVEGTASVDQHILTGESALAEKSAGDTIFAATIVVAGRIVLRSRQTGAETMAAQIGAVLNATNSYAAMVEARSMEVADKATIPSLLCGGLALVTQGPSAGLAALTADFGSSMRVMGPVAVLKHLKSGAEQGLYIKDGRSLELLRNVDTIIFDKTGTLTEPQPQVTRTHAWGEWSGEQVLALAAAAELRLTHPIARAIVEAARDAELNIPEVDQNSFEIGFGVRITLREGEVRVGSMRFMNSAGLRADADILAAEADAHGIGNSIVFVALNNSIIGAVEMRPSLKPGVEATLDGLRSLGLEIAILSGDHEVPTRALAQSLGIQRYFAGVLPDGKAAIIRQLQQDGRSVCFVGDGINDSIALKSAQVSVSFKEASTIATDAAQVVMIEDDLESLLVLFKLSRSLAANMQTSYQISMAGTGAVIVATVLLGAGLSGAVAVANACRIAGLANAMREPSEPVATSPAPPNTRADSRSAAFDPSALLPIGV